MTITRAETRRLKQAIEGIVGATNSVTGPTEGDAGLAETNIDMSTTVVLANNSTAALVSGPITLFGIIVTKEGGGGAGMLLQDGSSNLIHMGALQVGQTTFFYFPHGINITTDVSRSAANGNADFTFLYV